MSRLNRYAVTFLVVLVGNILLGLTAPVAGLLAVLAALLFWTRVCDRKVRIPAWSVRGPHQ